MYIVYEPLSRHIHVYDLGEINMSTFYFKQVSRETGCTIGYISYNGYYPTNDNDELLLTEISEEEFERALSEGAEEAVSEG